MATSAMALGKVCPLEVTNEIESCSLPFPLSQGDIAGKRIFLSILSFLSLWYLRLFSLLRCFVIGRNVSEEGNGDAVRLGRQFQGKGTRSPMIFFQLLHYS